NGRGAVITLPSAAPSPPTSLSTETRDGLLSAIAKARNARHQHGAQGRRGKSRRGCSPACGQSHATLLSLEAISSDHSAMPFGQGVSTAAVEVADAAAG